MDPNILAKNNQSETSQQKAVMCWAALEQRNYPELRWLFHVPNGGQRGVIAGARLRAEGVRKGIWDLHLPVTHRNASAGSARSPGGILWAGLWIEMKAPGLRNRKNGGLTDEQVEFGEFVKSQGYFTSVCYSFEEAKEVILTYLKF
jgi:hypothetical protein